MFTTAVQANIYYCVWFLTANNTARGVRFRLRFNVYLLLAQFCMQVVQAQPRETWPTV